MKRAMFMGFFLVTPIVLAQLYNPTRSGSSGTTSVSLSTTSLTVDGGANINGDIVGRTITLTSPGPGSIMTDGGAVIGGPIYADGGMTMPMGSCTYYDTTGNVRICSPSAMALTATTNGSFNVAAANGLLGQSSGVVNGTAERWDVEAFAFEHRPDPNSGLTNVRMIISDKGDGGIDFKLQGGGALLTLGSTNAVTDINGNINAVGRLSVDGGLQPSVDSSIFTAIYLCEQDINFPLIAANSTNQQTIPCSKAQGTDAVAASYPQNLEADLAPSAWITDAGVVTFRLANVNMLTGINPANGRFRAIIFRATP